MEPKICLYEFAGRSIIQLRYILNGFRHSGWHDLSTDHLTDYTYFERDPNIEQVSYVIRR